MCGAKWHFAPKESGAKYHFAPHGLRCANAPPGTNEIDLDTRDLPPGCPRGAHCHLGEFFLQKFISQFNDKPLRCLPSDAGNSDEAVDVARADGLAKVRRADCRRTGSC
jgi:hypothetical protein